MALIWVIVVVKEFKWEQRVCGFCVDVGVESTGCENTGPPCVGSGLVGWACRAC